MNFALDGTEISNSGIYAHWYHQRTDIVSFSADNFSLTEQIMENNQVYDFLIMISRDIDWKLDPLKTCTTKYPHSNCELFLGVSLPVI